MEKPLELRNFYNTITCTDIDTQHAQATLLCKAFIYGVQHPYTRIDDHVLDDIYFIYRRSMEDHIRSILSTYRNIISADCISFKAQSELENSYMTLIKDQLTGVLPRQIVRSAVEHGQGVGKELYTPTPRKKSLFGNSILRTWIEDKLLGRFFNRKKRSDHQSATDSKVYNATDIHRLAINAAYRLLHHTGINIEYSHLDHLITPINY